MIHTRVFGDLTDGNWRPRCVKSALFQHKNSIRRSPAVQPFTTQHEYRYNSSEWKRLRRSSHSGKNGPWRLRPAGDGTGIPPPPPPLFSKMRVVEVGRLAACMVRVQGAGRLIGWLSYPRQAGSKHQRLGGGSKRRPDKLIPWFCQCNAAANGSDVHSPHEYLGISSQTVGIFSAVICSPII